MPESLDLSFAFSGFYFVIALLILAGYAFYVYRYTIPVVSPAKKLVLVSLRSLALILLLFIIFEPIVTIANKNIIEPVNLIFTDNSRSITIDDGTNRSESVKIFLQDAESITDISEFYSFGNRVIRTDVDSLELISFYEGSTNFSNVFSHIEKEEKNISSIVIISDGVITEGSNPVYTAEKLGIPVYTIGVGDTARRNDIEIRNVLYNEYIYVETPTTINASFSNSGFEGKTINVSLFENDALVEQTSLTLTDGTQNLSFNYTPGNSGEKKLAVAVSNQPGEFTFANNRKTFYINVLSNKIKVLVIAGAPSSDLTFIKNSLKEDENLTVNSITQIASNRFLENNNWEKLIDSADIFYLVGFPSQETSNELLLKVNNAITSENKPFFIVLSDGVDFSKLRQIQANLPFSIGRSNAGYSEVQPNVSSDKAKNPLLQNNSENPANAWNNLPPALQPNTVLEAKPESEVLARVKINNVSLNRPLVVSRRLGSKRSIAVLAKDIWRWKLQTSTKNLNLFDNFVLQGVKWLNTSDEQKQVTIRTSKKLYSLGEEVEFSAQVYDQAFNPVADAEVKVNINSVTDKYEINLNSIGSGLYEGTLQTNKPGDYGFTGTAIQNGNILGADAGKFNIGEVDIEMISPNMDYSFLALLANRTGGKYFNADNYQQLFDLLKQRNQQTSKEKIIISEIYLWSNEWLMVVVIFLFAAEWFLRKRSGML
ncbi:MAG: VWA domain-containing protein [Ignavibacteriaceae bacterium]